MANPDAGSKRQLGRKQSLVSKKIFQAILRSFILVDIVQELLDDTDALKIVRGDLENLIATADPTKRDVSRVSSFS